ncbi:hypothetical protein LTR35_001671 [Friedmanniomyces endolithicus]|uniref:Uncharacterized protein n=1 Tax=Friedmanniomyces endolithicus TaxID=329885 RepID=A0AAN6J8S5_9PEZI|nr:hypothetical protein LTR35_001671 [Friedmanniomyces endolithicus]KAK0296757.1 hypothetical protein LTS00_004557 [Friedmanniomyces endolithicus]KAK0321564.1 hypothetical protein LTR82_007532 [Friedmanniomyces endolithicus]KAK1011244.1 hypothetical protein LTR54_005162 [Friedmanniomyces endolithicus]
MLREPDLEALPPAPPPAYDETLPSEPPPAYSSHLHRVTATHGPPPYISNTRWLLANDAPILSSSASGSGTGTTRSWVPGSGGGVTGRSWGEYVIVSVLFTVVVGATIGGALADARARSGTEENLWA